MRKNERNKVVRSLTKKKKKTSPQNKIKPGVQKKQLLLFITQGELYFIGPHLKRALFITENIILDKAGTVSLVM